MMGKFLPLYAPLRPDAVSKGQRSAGVWARRKTPTSVGQQAELLVSYT
jgi:hypothetical protein